MTETSRPVREEIAMPKIHDCVRFHFDEDGFSTKVGMINSAFWGNRPSDPSGGQTTHFVIWTLATKHEDNRRYEVPYEWVTEVIDLVDNDPLP